MLLLVVYVLWEARTVQLNWRLQETKENAG